MLTRNKLEMALEASSIFCTGVGAPFYVLDTGPNTAESR
jgi:hypothetical protein